MQETIDLGSIPGWGRSPGEGNGNPLQDSCLGNPMDRGASRTTVHGVAKSRTQLKWLSMHTHKLLWGPQESEDRQVRDKWWPLTGLDVTLRWRHASLLHFSTHNLPPNSSSPQHTEDTCVYTFALCRHRTHFMHPEHKDHSLHSRKLRICPYSYSRPNKPGNTAISWL